MCFIVIDFQLGVNLSRAHLLSVDPEVRGPKSTVTRTLNMRKYN